MNLGAHLDHLFLFFCDSVKSHPNKNDFHQMFDETRGISKLGDFQNSTGKSLE